MVWAGIAVRYDNGDIEAFELLEPRGQIRVSTVEMSQADFLAYLAAGSVPEVLTVQLQGMNRQLWAEGRQYARRAVRPQLDSEQHDD